MHRCCTILQTNKKNRFFIVAVSVGRVIFQLRNDDDDDDDFAARSAVIPRHVHMYVRTTYE